MVSALPRVPASTGWCESWGASPSSIGPCACSSVVTDFFEALRDFFFLLLFADLDDFDDLLEDFLLDFFFFEDLPVDLDVESACEVALASVCAIAPAVKKSVATAAAKSFRSCIRPSQKVDFEATTLPRTVN